MWIDIAIAVVAIAFAAIGWHEGLGRGLWAFTGVVVGSITGIALAPTVLQSLDLSVWLSIGALAFVAVLAVVGRWLALRVEVRARRIAGLGEVPRLARITGAGFAMLASLTVTWMLGFALAGSTLPGLSAEANRSAILALINRAHLPSSSWLIDQFRQLGQDSDFPRLVDVFTDEHIVDVPPPPADIAEDPDVRRAATSVWRVTTVDGPASGSQGSAFLFAEQRLLTAAHVVGRASAVKVDVGGERLDATVIHCDPEQDLAVLAVPDLDEDAGPILQFTSADAGDPAAAIGFPHNGEQRISPARIRERREWQSADIWGEGRFEHDAYVIRGVVRSGNSGGPLVDQAGRVLGVVVANSRVDKRTGYVLTSRQTLDATVAARGPVKAVTCSTA